MSAVFVSKSHRSTTLLSEVFYRCLVYSKVCVDQMGFAGRPLFGQCKFENASSNRFQFIFWDKINNGCVGFKLLLNEKNNDPCV